MYKGGEEDSFYLPRIMFPKTDKNFPHKNNITMMKQQIQDLYKKKIIVCIIIKRVRRFGGFPIIA